MRKCWMSWRSFKPFGIALLCLATLSGCQMLQSDDEPVLDPTRLESLSRADLEPAFQAFPKIDAPELDQVIESYTQLLPLLVEPEDKLKTLQRLADLKLAKGEELMAEQAVDELDIAIEAYQQLLERYPEREVNDGVYYQLAKTYDLKGNSADYFETLTTLVTRYPDSQFVAESHFRRGEVLFSEGDYYGAEQAFEQVVSHGETAFLANAYYMKGWSEFKQTRYQDGLMSYIAVLDLVLPTEARTVTIEAKNQTMVKDLLRVMGLSFSYLGGADALEELFRRGGPRNYEILVYDHYSDLLLQKEQYTDAIEVYKRFIDLHALDLNAPRYQLNIITTFAKAGFRADIVSEKVRYVDTYGIDSEFWAANQGENLEDVLKQLNSLLPELANRQYVLAQKAEKQGKRKESLKHYAEAADYYERYVYTFPVAEDIASIRVLLGECYVALQDWPSAIFSFESAAYDFPDFEGAAEAGYASIIAYNEYAKTWTSLDEETRLFNEQRRQESRLQFVNAHSSDARADNVFYIALQFEFSNKQFEQSVLLADRLLGWQPRAETALLVEARVIKAHSTYELARYPEAESAYVVAIEGLPKGDQRAQALLENLAASVYKQAEAYLAAVDKNTAISELLRVGVAAPGAKLRSYAEYDAIGYMIELKQWQPAIEEMSKFRARYADHALINTLVPKMALAYRETEQWELAGDELNTMIALATTDQEKQDNQFIAAELYDRAGNNQKAINAYRTYANRYPDPADVYMEAANRLAEIYDETDDQLKRRFWLNKQIKRVDALGDQADDRMVYLAAGASAVLADDAFQRYARIKLKLPLNKSMIAKTEALEKAMKAYQKTASYGISSYATESGYRMADIYAQLSRDLMDSDRPGGLNELELEQYEILLEEQAFPFEDSAIEIHEQNASRSWVGIYDEWIKNSFNSLKQLLPGRYDKPESLGELISVLP